MVMNSELVWKLNRWILADDDIRDLMEYDGTGPRPIFPAQEEPEAEVPYIRYTHRMSPDNTMWWMHNEEIVYVIYDLDMDRSAKIKNVLVDLFQREDESAADFRDWLRATNQTAEHELHSLEVVTTMSPTPVEQEGGKHARFVTVRARYSPKVGRGIRWS